MRLGVFVGSSKIVTPEAPQEMQMSRDTPWGQAACVPRVYPVADHELVFLPRHGVSHELAPHQINYRANVWLLREAGVDAVIATYTVGGIAADLKVADVVVPHQLIDYTWGRAGTFDDELRHIDFSYPFDPSLRRRLLQSSPDLIDRGVYGCTQGPRLETAAEIRRLAADGCTLVGMTGMPEAALCREAGLRYAALCLVVNPAAGVGDDPLDPMPASEVAGQGVDMEALQTASREGAQRMLRVLQQFVRAGG